MSTRDRSPLALALTLAILCAGSASAQAPAVTRWMDPQGRLRPAHAPEAAGGPLKMTLARVPSARGAPIPPGAETNRVCLVVHTNVVGALGAALSRYQADLGAAGYSVLLYTYESGSAENLRAYLAGLYAQPNSLAGAVLVGEIPYIVYEMYQDWGNGNEYEDFPCDIFYADLNGTWADTNSAPPFSAGKYDSRSGNLDLEIWISRLKAGNLPALGAETDSLARYFDKNHRYRERQLVPHRRALAYVDDDWSYGTGEDAECLGWRYGDAGVRAVMDADSTTAADYMAFMTNSYELMFVRSHGYPGGHGFYESGKTAFNYVLTDDYLDLAPPALFYSFFVCSGCDFATSDNLGSLVAFNADDSGLACWGSTKTGGMWDDRYFYEPLAEGASLGSAFKAWFNVCQTNWPSYAPPWWYGMVILGDGALALSGTEPAGSAASGWSAAPVVSSPSVQGGRYQLRRTASLAAPAWTNVGSIVTAAQFAVSLSDTNALVDFAAYRVVKLEDGTSNLLRNASFEMPGSSDSRARYWEDANPDSHGNIWSNVSRVAWRCYYGGAEAAVRGTWAGVNIGGWWQEAPATAGSNYQASAWFWADHSANVWTAAVQELKIEFLDSGYSLLGSSSVGLSGVVESWTQKTVSAVAPANTAWARFVVNVSGASAQGALQFDDAELVRSP
ncbi:MAG TPA: hypothetical protein P5567_13655 [Kiritimatiellia bacterium]|nr:hypothetical protein [Kiritimatiellia bacterium]HRZ13489.1 hypothetical protein [Kiritimatiellia bacterium]HSA19206.1 hypothetical protein [Kiritimatiellia bacterium]